MRARPLLVAVLAAAAAACSKPAPQVARAPRPNYLIDVPYLAQSILQDTTGTPEAQHVVLLAPAPIDSVARFYRHRLPAMGWQILSDVGDTVRVSLYLVRSGQPMWVQIDAQGPQSRVSYTATGGTPSDTSRAAR
jgi:hypothetical protein